MAPLQNPQISSEIGDEPPHGAEVLRFRPKTSKVQIALRSQGKIWTPEFVQLRLVEAYDVLRRSPMRIGPKGAGNCWMQVVDIMEIDESLVRNARVDIEAHRRLKALRAEIEGIRAAKEQQQRERSDRAARNPAPTSVEVAKADEALHWCVRYLKKEPMQADALQLWAVCGAWSHSVAKALRDRMEQAQKLIQAHESYDDDDRREEQRRTDRHDKNIQAALRKRVVDIAPVVEVRQSAEDAAREARRAEVLAKVAAWANERLGGARDAAHADAIRANAQIKAEREVKAEAPLRKVKPADVMPGKCFTRTWLDAQRRLGAAAIAAGLNRDRVEVR